MKIVFLDGHTLNPGDISWKAFEEIGEYTVYDRTERSEILPRSVDADILITNKTPLSRETLNQLPRLRMICVAAAGFDVIDVAAARERGIPVCNAAGYGTEAVAQMVFSLLLEATNQVGYYATENRKGFWSHSKDFCCWNSPLIELNGKRLGIVGFGNIGQAVARIGQAFGMPIACVSSKKTLPDGVERMSIADLFAKCDVVSLNCPLSTDNAGFVNAELLSKSKPGLILVNTARGKLIDDEAVAEALKSGRLQAYCCDVLSHEPPAADHPLLSLPNAFVTPHIAWATFEARQRLIDIMVQNIHAFLSGKPQNVVNP